MNQTIPSLASESAELDHNNGDHDDQEFISQLPKAKGWWDSGVTQYQGFWFPTMLVQNIINFQRHFKPNDHDMIILASTPKSGITWLKALLFSIVNRTRFTPSNTPLLTTNPHKLIPFFEFSPYKNPREEEEEEKPFSDNIDIDNKNNNIKKTESPRLFATHIPFSVLPESMKSSSKCKIIYVCRNPLDVIVSFFHFSSQEHPNCSEKVTMEGIVDRFCAGYEGFGPFWDHVLGFWNASLETPERVMFLKYEDMKEDAEARVKELAGFVGFPFSEEEEKNGVVREICDLCSLKSLKEMDLKNKHEPIQIDFENKHFYRNGEVGGWANELSSSMVERVEKVISEKLGGSNLTFKKSA